MNQVTGVLTEITKTQKESIDVSQQVQERLKQLELKDKELKEKETRLNALEKELNLISEINELTIQNRIYAKEIELQNQRVADHQRMVSDIFRNTGVRKTITAPVVVEAPGTTAYSGEGQIAVPGGQFVHQEQTEEISVEE